MCCSLAATLSTQLEILGQIWLVFLVQYVLKNLAIKKVTKQLYAVSLVDTSLILGVSCWEALSKVALSGSLLVL